MNNDLISRSELKKHKITTQVCNGLEIESADAVLVTTIDNAPPVEVPEDTVNCVLTMFGKCSYNKTGCSDCEIKDKICKALNVRPKAEWIEKVERRGCFAGDKTVYSYTCPFCGAKEFKKYPFCHCGAEMRVKSS